MNTKCPNCGSTAQVQLMQDYGKDNAGGYLQKYSCGCGCVFLTYEINNIKNVFPIKWR